MSDSTAFAELPHLADSQATLLGEPEILALKPFAAPRKGCYNGSGLYTPDNVNTVADLKLLPVWVNPEHLASTAKILIAGHRLRALAVVDKDRLLGQLIPGQLAEAPDDAPVRDFVVPAEFTVSASTPIAEVAALLHSHDLDYVFVIDEGRYRGMVTAAMLLPLIGRNWDPLTGLAWSDRLREWGVVQLKEGHEVTILFVDLDDFGLYNKQFGHVVGDRVLQRISAMLRDAVREPEDLLVRYAGDEFAIATVRSREQADVLAREIKSKGAGLFVSGTDHAVTFSVGVFGGRRTKERENVHYAATLDSLINLASKDGQAQKVAAKSARRALDDEQGLPEPEMAVEDGSKGRTILVVDVGADDRSPSPLTPVMLSKGGQVVSGVHTRQGIPLIESVVLATAKAVERLLPQAKFSLDEVRLSERGDGTRLVSVSGRVTIGEREFAVSSARAAAKDLYVAAAETAVEAILSAEPLRDL